jgi:ABC-type nitrate/sulfonate/bicarbonate transport system substrate-binding protein
VVTRDNLKKNRGQYVKFERAVIRAEEYLAEHPTESFELVAKFLNIPTERVRSFFHRPGFSLYANPNTKGAVAFANIMRTRLGSEKVGDVQESMDTSVYEDALLGLIKDEPKNKVLTAMLAKYRRTQ